MNTGDEPKRLCLFTSALGGGGVQRSIRQLAAGLVARGYVVDLVVCHGEPALARALETAGVSVHVLRPTWPGVGRVLALRADPGGFAQLGPTVLWPIKTWRKLSYLKALRDHLRQHPPHGLLSAMTQCNLVALWAHRLAGAPGRVVVSERNMLSAFITRHADKSCWRHLAPLVARSYRQANAIVAVSHAVADDLAKTTGLARTTIQTAPNPVVDEELRAAIAASPPPAEVNTPPTVLGVGRLVDQKDPMTLLHAFATVYRERPARLVLIGDGDMRDTLRAEAERLGITAAVELPGWDDQPFAAMRRADVFVLPSRWEGLPGVLIQALACGCRIVATQCPGGNAEILENGRHGRLVPVGDRERMAIAIRDSLDDPGDVAARRARAEDFSTETASACYTALLDPVSPSP